MLSARLRAARKTAGLSQEAVAKIMRDRGFAWRQTTVAKSEAKDRPILFSEVIALSAIYKKPIDYFLYAGAELDELYENATAEFESITEALRDARSAVRALENDVNLYQGILGMAASLVRYRNTGVRDTLRDDLSSLFTKYGDLCLTFTDLFESVGVEEDDLTEVDQAALLHVAGVEAEHHRRLSPEGGAQESGAMMLGVADFLEGKEVHPGLLAALRSGGQWAKFVANMLSDTLVERIEVDLALDRKN
ncbi:helix-turn-helix transcriptional regulator [Streptomyces sp. NPDC005480]|uniref:helix-turn-helix domain-containing protein n=1 Tax=Streptomyces sp. NPDC005480 TaxID=3154880 RepID=UPI0033A8DB87